MEKRFGEYLQQTLRGEDTVSESMDSECRVSFMIPVYAEPVHRILEILESISAIEDAALRSEVLVLVNNPEDDGSERMRRAIAMNGLVLGLPVWRNRDPLFGSHQFSDEIIDRAHAIRERLPVYVIDKSSRGQELAGGNIGRARNRLLAEAVLRFERSGREGLLISTDADARFPDSNYLQKVLTIFDAEPELVAVSGGIDLVFDPDQRIQSERDRLRGVFDRFILERAWEEIARYYDGKESDLAPPDAFFGSHLITRSHAAALVGGFPHRAKNEDSYFGQALRRFAQERGLRVGNAKRLLRAQVALRESDRTAASFLPILLRDLHPGKAVIDPDTNEKVPLTYEVAERACRNMHQSAAGRGSLQGIGDLSRLLYKSVLL